MTFWRRFWFTRSLHYRCGSLSHLHFAACMGQPAAFGFTFKHHQTIDLLGVTPGNMISTELFMCSNVLSISESLHKLVVCVKTISQAAYSTEN